MTLYAESSAVLAWLLGERPGDQVKAALSSADLVVASELTIIECTRALIRSASIGAIAEADATDRKGHLSSASTTWGYVSYCVQNRLRKTSGHGKRLITEIDLLTKEHRHDHSSQA